MCSLMVVLRRVEGFGRDGGVKGVEIRAFYVISFFSVRTIREANSRSVRGLLRLCREKGPTDGIVRLIFGGQWKYFRRNNRAAIARIPRGRYVHAFYVNRIRSAVVIPQTIGFIHMYIYV